MHLVRRAIIAIMLIGPLVVAAVIYIGLIVDGHIAPPDLQAVAQAVLPAAAGGFGLVVGVVATGVLLSAVIAPVLYAVRSGDILTVLVSIVMTTTAIALFATAKSAIHEILAVLVYLANTVLSATVYAAHRIAQGGYVAPR